MTDKEQLLWERYANLDYGMSWLWETLSDKNLIPDDYQNQTTRDIIETAIDEGDLTLQEFEELLNGAEKAETEDEVDGEAQCAESTNSDLTQELKKGKEPDTEERRPMKEYRVNVYVPWKITGEYIVDVDVEAASNEEAMSKATHAVREMTQDDLLDDCGGTYDDPDLLDSPEFLNSGPEFSPECNIEWEKELEAEPCKWTREQLFEYFHSPDAPESLLQDIQDTLSNYSHFGVENWSDMDIDDVITIALDSNDLDLEEFADWLRIDEDAHRIVKRQEEGK